MHALPSFFSRAQTSPESLPDVPPPPGEPGGLPDGGPADEGDAGLDDGGEEQPELPPFDPEGVPVPSVSDRHLLSRFSCGVTPALVADAAALGGARAWFEQQLYPQDVPDPAGRAVDDWWPHLWWAPSRKWEEEMSGHDQDIDFTRWSLMQRIVSSRQLHEVMADFWSNLFYIQVPTRKAYAHRVQYDMTIRQNSLGKFEDLLKAAVLHPAMLCYLDNARSTKDAPNENLGRELLELHTVGHEAGFSEFDVLSSCRILTGYRVEITEGCEPFYSREDHYTGYVRVMAYDSPNESGDGRAVADEYLTYLANHSATARRVAHRLAVRFVSDTPSDALVEHLAEVFQSSGTDIRTTLRALVDHPEFTQSVGQKVRTPAEDFVNTYRVLGVNVLPPVGRDGEAAAVIVYVCGAMGQQLFGWPRPDGFPDDGEAWSSASRMLACWRVHKNTAARAYPDVGVEYRAKEYWFPQLPVRFSDLVDRLCRMLLLERATPTLLETVARAVDFELDEIVDRDTPLLDWLFPPLMNAVIDTPNHMSR